MAASSENGTWDRVERAREPVPVSRAGEESYLQPRDFFLENESEVRQAITNMTTRHKSGEVHELVSLEVSSTPLLLRV